MASHRTFATCPRARKATRFVTRVRNGAVRDGRVYMPKFEGILSQEALWTIRAYLDTVQQK